MVKVGISEKQFEEALLRHEKAFEKELEDISTDEKELRKMILKMKKAMIEQVRQNNSTYCHAVDAIQSLNNFNRRMDLFESRLADLNSKTENCINAFSESVKILKEMQVERQESKMSFFSKLKRFFGCQKK